MVLLLADHYVTVLLDVKERSCNLVDVHAKL